ncbi:MAG: porin family protein [Bacteroidetes bacterium]|nr:porin family protein [Bacteroidota bacterium]MDA1120629.1 porin family protein [Bacteroidota bacterium]
MKKVLLVSLVIISSFDIFSQLRIGLRFGGAVSNPRINEISDTLDISKKETSIKPLFGLTLDFPIKDNVIFSSGLGYAPKKISIDYTGNSGNFEGSEEHKLQYIQIPLLIRFITNEISPGMKLYFTTGFTGDVKVFQESNLKDPEIVDKFQPIDASFNLGGGLEFSLGPDTDFYGGLVYYRGLINSMKDAVSSDANLRINNDLLGIEVGIRF